MAQSGSRFFRSGLRRPTPGVLTSSTILSLIGVLAPTCRPLADCLAALSAYEAARSGPTAQVVRTNREHPPDYLIRRVEELVGDVPLRCSSPLQMPLG
jgi:hypothetical protein